MGDGRLPADSATDGEALFEEALHDPDGDVAIAAGDENPALIDGWHCDAAQWYVRCEVDGYSLERGDSAVSQLCLEIIS